MNRTIILIWIAAALSLQAGPTPQSETKPVFTMGVITDTHFYPDGKHEPYTRLCYEFYKRHHTDLILHLGDLADSYDERSYALYRKMIDEVFPAGQWRPKLWYCCAGHDRNGYRSADPGKSRDEASYEAYEKMLGFLGAEHKVVDMLEYKGYAFFTFPQLHCVMDDVQASLKRLAEKAKAEPGKPIFVLDHHPGYDTTFDSKIWGWKDRNEWYSQIPEIVHLCGHTHSPTFSDTVFWQGAYNAYDCGCVKPWGSLEAYRPREQHPGLGATIIEVYSDRILFRRYDPEDGKEFRPELPLSITLPYDPSKAYWSRAAVIARDRRPDFPSGAIAGCEELRTPDGEFRGWKCTVPEATVPDDLWKVRVELQRFDNGGWKRLTYLEHFGEFWKPMRLRNRYIACEFGAGLFEEDAVYRFVVTPLSCWGQTGGKLVSNEFRARCLQTLEEIYREQTHRRIVKDKYFAYWQVPDEVFAKARPGDRLRVRYSFRAEGCSATQAAFRQSDGSGRREGIKRTISPVIALPEGDGTPVELTFDFTRHEADEKYFFLSHAGVNGVFGINDIRVYRIVKPTKTVAFLGGSITQNPGYRTELMKYLGTKYPGERFRFIPAGLSSTCSTSAAFRFGERVLRYGRPDILFFEDAVNDAGDAHASRERAIRGVEGVIRQALRANPKMKIVLGLMVGGVEYSLLRQKKVPPVYAAHIEVAEHYGIPVANVGTALVAVEEAKTFSWKEYGGTHPSPAGGAFAARVWAAAFETLSDESPERTLPEPLLKDCYDGARFLDPPAITLSEGADRDGKWAYSVPPWWRLKASPRRDYVNEPILWCEKPGDEVTVRFRGRLFGVFSLSGPHCGNVEVSVDGGEWREFDLWGSFSKHLAYPWMVMFAENLSDGEHNARIRVSKNRNPQSDGHQVLLYRLCVCEGTATGGFDRKVSR